MMNTILEFLAHFGAMHYVVIAINLLLMLLAKPLILKTGGKLTKRQIGFRVNMLSVLNLAILAAVCYNAIYSNIGNNGRGEQGIAVKLISILLTQEKAAERHGRAAFP